MSAITAGKIPSFDVDFAECDCPGSFGEPDTASANTDYAARLPPMLI